MSNTKTVYHPDLPDTSYEVPAKDADAWRAKGWRFTPRPAGDAKSDDVSDHAPGLPANEQPTEAKKAEAKKAEAKKAEAKKA